MVIKMKNCSVGITLTSMDNYTVCLYYLGTYMVKVKTNQGFDHQSSI